MRYLFSLLFPPLGILLCGKPFQAVLCFFPGALYALLTASNYYADRRSDRHADRTIRAMEEQAEAIQELARSQARKARALANAPQSIAAPRPGRSVQPQPRLDFEEDEPAKPKMTFAELLALAKEAVLSIKSESIRAYRNMPEWAQPITWGLAGGSVLSLGLVIFLAARRV